MSMKPSLLIPSIFYLFSNSKYIHFQLLLGYLHHQPTDLSLALVYSLEDSSYIIKITMG